MSHFPAVGKLEMELNLKRTEVLSLTEQISQMKQTNQVQARV